MLRKVLVGMVIGALVASLGLFLWARSVLAGDTVRTALAAQLSKAIGQPVTIASIGATVYPRVSVNLGGVTIGDPARVTVDRPREPPPGRRPNRAAAAGVHLRRPVVVVGRVARHAGRDRLDR
jgi:uncharacterized protein involved in outer membrane biogenesis